MSLVFDIFQGEYFSVPTSKGVEIVPVRECLRTMPVAAEGLQNYVQGTVRDADELIDVEKGWIGRLINPDTLYSSAFAARPTEVAALGALCALQADNMRNTFVNLLEYLGWTKGHGAALVSKCFETAVGPKEAHIYCAELNGEEHCFYLQGEYWSEGRNALSTCTYRIPKDCDPAQLPDLLFNYVEQLESAVEDTFAARLYQRRADRPQV